MFGAVSDRRWIRYGSESPRRPVPEWVERIEEVSSVWELSGLATDLCKVLFRREDISKSRMLLATSEVGLDRLGVLFLLDMRLSSGVARAGVTGGGLGSRLFELELATLHGRCLLLSSLSGER